MDRIFLYRKIRDCILKAFAYIKIGEKRVHRPAEAFEAFLENGKKEQNMLYRVLSIVYRYLYRFIKKYTWY